MIIDEPRIKPGVFLSCENSTVSFKNGPFEVSFEARDKVPGELPNPGTSSVNLRSWLYSVLGTDSPEAIAGFIQKLVAQGVIIESAPLDAFDGEYVGYRLVDYYRILINRLLVKNPLMHTLQNGAHKNVQIGVLLETYYMIRNADWTAPAVLGHWLPEQQRKLLQEFFEEESGHGELLADGFASVGLDPDAVRKGVPQPETLSYNLCFYTAANLSPAHFAASIIVPEVPQSPRASVHDNSESDILSLLTDIPDDLIRCARSHEEIDDDEDHGNLPVELLAVEGALSRDRIASLFEIVHQTTVSLDWLFRGVERHYSDWDQEVGVGWANEAMGWPT
ncbi:heme oxygenase-like domain-containing protein [Nocardiopsis valliformis]|uniref:hypothetical protein n=1 Tax=Nocardiopsis valliformis TaxID=239974 RepID=UPI0012696DEE|nr:hypothetical protein [Nocardiopsis valliformis]